jgi:AcrR family transcriptional regulator
MDIKQDLTTREKILDVSIDLFAQKGFRDISVREIAKAVGIKASSLYKHYENKEDILESIFTLFREKIVQTSYPKEELRRYINAVPPMQYLDESFQLFKQVMWSPLTLKIAKIITIEQQRNQSVRKFFVQELIEKPNETLRYVFDLMVENGSIHPLDTRVLAEEYNSYIIFLFFEQNFLHESINLDEIERKMKQHNEFYAHNILNGKGAN